MISITDKKLCCGCTACKNICPQKCIKMVPDKEGFLYPVVDTRNCVECKACERVCPVLNERRESRNKIQAYALRTRLKSDLMNSTSGGFTTPLAEWVFQNGGKVWAASYNEKWEVYHRKFDSLGKMFNKSKGSKYVQSYLGNVFAEIKETLNAQIMVCFIGTTCQVYGLKSYLGKEYDNLITVDLVCHGTPSPKLWRKYIEYQRKKYKSKIKTVNFRNKTYGYHSGTMKLEFENGKQYTGSARVDPMLKSFFSEISSRPICYSCPFKHLNRVSDFTIFDCWHVTELIPNFKDDDCGYTNVLVHTEKGNRVLSEIKNKYYIYPVNMNKAIELDGIMVLNSAIPHKRRSTFYNDLDQRDIREHVQKYIPISWMDYILEKSKGIAYKFGLMEKLRNIKR